MTVILKMDKNKTVLNLKIELARIRTLEEEEMKVQDLVNSYRAEKG